MDTFAIAVVSVVVLASAAWGLRKYANLRVCPICAAVSGTWAWLLVARALGMWADPAVLALLLGGSVVAGAQWIEARLPQGRAAGAWKALAILAGFVAAYGVARERWTLAGAGIALAAVLLAVFLLPAVKARDPTTVAQLEERMKRCC